MNREPVLRRPHEFKPAGHPQMHEQVPALREIEDNKFRPPPKPVDPASPQLPVQFDLRIVDFDAANRASTQVRSQLAHHNFNFRKFWHWPPVIALTNTSPPPARKDFATR